MIISDTCLLCETTTSGIAAQRVTIATGVTTATRVTVAIEGMTATEAKIVIETETTKIAIIAEMPTTKTDRSAIEAAATARDNRDTKCSSCR